MMVSILEKRLEKDIESLQKNLFTLLELLKDARAENEVLKEEEHRSKAITRLRKEVKQLKDDLAKSFNLTNDERKNVNAFVNVHNYQCNYRGLEYVFVPTSLGDEVEIRCPKCGRSQKIRVIE